MLSLFVNDSPLRTLYIKDDSIDLSKLANGRIIIGDKKNAFNGLVRNIMLKLD